MSIKPTEKPFRCGYTRAPNRQSEKEADRDVAQDLSSWEKHSLFSGAVLHEKKPLGQGVGVQLRITRAPPLLVLVPLQGKEGSGIAHQQGITSSDHLVGTLEDLQGMSCHQAKATSVEWIPLVRTAQPSKSKQSILRGGGRSHHMICHARETRILAGNLSFAEKMTSHETTSSCMVETNGRKRESKTRPGVKGRSIYASHASAGIAYMASQRIATLQGRNSHEAETEPLLESKSNPCALATSRAWVRAQLNQFLTRRLFCASMRSTPHAREQVGTTRTVRSPRTCPQVPNPHIGSLLSLHHRTTPHAREQVGTTRTVRSPRTSVEVK
ncbi:hypothetical protein VNO77_27197 [Canavalia gladiata]|uniref:Uncharacterized protein n=1 Tax=Canavalia gladiata TaxID=3824 RepID=A0AAN9KWI1_CANGL